EGHRGLRRQGPRRARGVLLRSLGPDRPRAGHGGKGPPRPPPGGGPLPRPGRGAGATPAPPAAPPPPPRGRAPPARAPRVTGPPPPASNITLGTAITNATPALVASLAVEIAPVRINLVAPGFVDTPLSASLLGDDLDKRRDELRSTLPIGRVVGPEDVAAL